MILRQFLHTEPVVAASYLVGCGGHGVAAVIDPVSAPSAYLDAARALGLRVVCVADTHAHADHLSTGRDLARAAGCDYLLHASAPARFPFRRAEDGDTIALGNVELQVLHTPGHTPEHLCLLVTDRTRGADPWLLLTGHTLMVGDVGRVELASDLDTGAAALHDSLARLLTLPDHLLIYPGAFSGSVCGRGLSGHPVSTLGFERRYNPGLRPRTRAEFVAFLREDVPPRPENADAIRASNLGWAQRAAG
jgi:glyoxylase-like metal-dependent hydrolase (beta-lactamase superfamily II)